MLAVIRWHELEMCVSIQDLQWGRMEKKQKAVVTKEPGWRHVGTTYSDGPVI